MVSDSLDEDALFIHRVPITVTPPVNDPKWIKNPKGDIVGHENTYEMTRAEVKERYGK